MMKGRSDCKKRKKERENYYSKMNIETSWNAIIRTRRGRKRRKWDAYDDERKKIEKEGKKKEYNRMKSKTRWNCNYERKRRKGKKN